MAPRGKRKREDAAATTSAMLCDETRITDAYLLNAHACKFADHHRKKSKGAMTIVANCAENPNCLFGLGEHQEGIWMKKKLVQRVLGDDPREQLRALYPSASDPAAPSASRRKNSATLSQGSDGDNSSSRTTSLPPTQRFLPCGLRNLGATCYLNSMLQTLFTNVQFRAAVYEWEPKALASADDPLAHQMRALQKLFGLMQLGHKASADPNEFAATLALNSVLQQDVQEFSKLLLTHLRVIFSQSRIAGHWDLVDRIFQGQMSYVTTCLRCRHRSERLSSYYEISLNIKGHKTVQACLESYLSAEVLEGENKYFCDHCASKERAERCIELDPQRLPQTITLQLMRFVYDANAGRKKKLMDVIEVNETLNMTKLLRRSGNASVFSDAPDAVYRLSGYLNHRGRTTHAGHYTASVAYPKPEDPTSVEWFEFDDSVVNNMASIVDTEGSKERTGKILRSRDAYMLLYTRVDDDAAERTSAVASTVASTAPLNTVMPATECLDEILALNAAFDADVHEYVANASALEARIDARLDAYHRYFEVEAPAPLPDADDFYWVDTAWLRSWIVGIETQPQLIATQVESAATTPDEATSSAAKQCDSENIKTQPSSSSLLESAGASQDMTVKLEMDVSAIALHRAESDVDAIPFARPLDLARFCCIHSVDANKLRIKKAATTAVGPKASSFSPENVAKLKRVSAGLFEHLRSTCGIVSNSVSTTSSSRSRRTSDTGDPGVVFAAATFRCRECHDEFCNKLLDDAELLREVERELALLRAPVESDAFESPFLMSRAWIASYKTHLIDLQRSIVHKPSRRFNSHDTAAAAATTTTSNSSSSLSLQDEVWRRGLNDDIACVHGKLALEKKKYRTVSAATWRHFSAKFPRHNAFEERTTEPCAQCQIAAAESDEIVQGERACRDIVLTRAPLARLFRRRSAESDATFSLRAAFLPSGSVGGAPQRELFVVPRAWLERWRAYIRDVECSAPPSLTCDSLRCAHNKLLLPQAIRTSLQGGAVDASSVDVEFVSRDEMVHLGELYGVPTDAYFYGALRPDDSVEWRSCLLAALLGCGDADSKDGSTTDMLQATCSECEAASELEHLDAMQNFCGRAVHVHLLAPDQAVPTNEKLAVEATNASGRQRRSKRIRAGTNGSSSGASWRIVANSSDSVYVFKTKVYDEIDAYPTRQRLYFAGRVLEDRLTLKDCGIKAGDAVFMRLSDETPDDAGLGDDALEREVGFADSVFLRRAFPHGAASAAVEPSRVWVCSACTFVNDETDIVCEMCGTDVE